MKRKMKIGLIAFFAFAVLFGLFFTMDAKAASGHYDVFIELIDQTTEQAVSNPNVKYTFYSEDGSAIETGNTSNAAYFISLNYTTYYYSGSTKPVKVKVELDGWIFEKDIYDIVFEDSGTSGVVECRMEIPVWPDESLETLTVYAGLNRDASTTEKVGQTMKIRKTGEKEFSQEVVTDDTGYATFSNLEPGAYDVYWAEKGKFYYIYPTSTGERYAHFNTSSYTHYLQLRSSFSSFYRHFAFEITTEDGTVVEPSNSDGTRWTLPGGADYYLTTTKVPDGYTGEVFDHEPVIPYTNYGETIYFEPDYDIEFYQMKNSNYNIYSGSETGNFTARKIGEAESDSLMDAFTEFWFKTFLKGTTIQNEIIKIPAAEAVISNENKTEESSEEVVEVEQYAIWVQKTKGASYTFDLTATVNGTDVTTPVKIVVSENETYNYPGFIDEATLKVTKKNNSVSMSWTAPNDYVDYYLVHRYNPNGTTKEYKLNKTSFNHTGLTAGKTYNYSIYCVYTLNGEEGYVCTPLDREVKLITLKAVTGAKASNNKLHSIKLSWKKVTNAAGYQVKRLNNAGKVLKTMTTTNLYLTDKSLAAATKYTYKIRPYYVENGVKKYGPTVTLKTATICKVPAAPTLKAGTKSMKVSFKKVTGASGYQIVYSTSKKFTSATTKKTTVTGTNATISKTIKSLTKGKTYYVKVRAYVKTATGAKVYTGYSTVKSVKVK